MAKKNANDLPTRAAVLKLAKEIELLREWGGSEESRAAKEAVDERKSVLLRDPLLKKLRAKAERLEEKHRGACEKHNEARKKLIQRVQLEPITPKLLSEVRMMLGLPTK